MLYHCVLLGGHMLYHWDCWVVTCYVTGIAGWSHVISLGLLGGHMLYHCEILGGHMLYHWDCWVVTCYITVKYWVVTCYITVKC